MTVQPVSAAVDGAGSQYVDRDAADWQVPALHVHPRLYLSHHLRLRPQPHAEVSSIY